MAEAEKYFEIALRNLVMTATNLVEAGFEWIAVGSNGHDSTDFHHVTLDPGVDAIQERIRNRSGPLDDSKTAEWLESQLLWFRD